jgi:uncharacterized protein
LGDVDLTRIFRVALVVALVHAVDDAFVHRQPGVPGDQHLVAAAVAIALGAAAIVGFGRLRPGVRSGVSLTLGVFAIANGAQHIAHVAEAGPAHSDVTGLMAFVAGLVLVGVGLVIPWRERGERPATARRRWRTRAVAVVLGGFATLFVVFPVTVAIVATHKYRGEIGQPPPGYRAVHFAAADGLELRGWYRPSQNRAAVVVVHGGGGDRTGALRHARLLARHGYGVLVYDSRGRGESDGSPNVNGWGWDHDVVGALTYLRRRPDVDPERVGGLGLSTGADVLIEVGAKDRHLKAVVSDGATGRSTEDRPEGGYDPVSSAYFASYFAALRVLSGDKPGPPLKKLAAQVSPTPLFLIGVGSGIKEREFNRVYAEAAREPVHYWELPDVSHSAAIRERPREYERRVVGFFDSALLPRD